MDTNQGNESDTSIASLNVTKDDIDNVMLYLYNLDGNSGFEYSEIALKSENSVEQDSYITRIQAQLDEEIMRDIEAEAKIFEAIKVSKGYRSMIAKESFEKKSEESKSVSKVFKRTAKNEDMYDSSLIIADSGVEDIATTKDSLCVGTEYNFHTEIINEKNAMNYINDGVEDITQCSIDYNLDGYKMDNGLEKEILENLCKKKSEKLVKNNPHTLMSTQITQNNNEEIKGTCIKSKRKLQTTKKSIKTKRKSKETNTYVVPKKQKIKTPNNYKYMQKGNTSGAQTPVINTITAKFQCNECGKQFSTRTILTYHILKCMTPKTLVNDGQPKKADTLNSLLSEMYNCDICTFKTNQKRSIEKHLKMHGNTKVVSCDICDYRCEQKSHLIDHIRTHTAEKPFSCNICKYRCANKSTLKVHIRTHTGEKPFPCNICEYRCARKSHLKTHIRTHTGEKPYSCNICEYRCSQRSHLKDHLRTHTGEKPYSCNICEYRCSQRSHLKDHIRTHTGQKPFSCNICEYRCSQKSHLKDHIRTHTGEK